MNSQHPDQSQTSESPLQLIKKHELISKQEFLQAVEDQTGRVLDVDLDHEELESYRDYLYGNTLFSGSSGDAKLLNIVKENHPGLRFDSKIPRILKDFAKVCFQEILEEAAIIMHRTKQDNVDEIILEEANWNVSERLWKNKQL